MVEGVAGVAAPARLAVVVASLGRSTSGAACVAADVDGSSGRVAAGPGDVVGEEVAALVVALVLALVNVFIAALGVAGFDGSGDGAPSIVMPAVSTSVLPLGGGVKTGCLPDCTAAGAPTFVRSRSGFLSSTSPVPSLGQVRWLSG